MKPQSARSAAQRALLGCALALAAATAQAQTYPDHQIRMIIPFAAGGPADIVGRLVAQKLSESLKQPVVPENRTGATGGIGAEFVAKSAPDGYTLFLSSSSIMSANPVLNTKISYDPIRDFSPISLTATIENVLVVNPSVPAKTIAELITYAKANPNKLSYSSSGIGSTYHLSGELFAAATGTKLLHVPYKGAAPAAMDVLAGNISLMFDNIPSALPNIKTGKVRALGVASLKRYKDLPEVPTIAESGVPGYEVIIWTALYAPAKTPRPIIDILNHATVAALAAPDMQERYAKLGMNPESCTPEYLLEYNKADLAKWGKVVKDANIKME
jgi:tripartite-type tricarboxylate transporter receptor subunit TctC